LGLPSCLHICCTGTPPCNLLSSPSSSGTWRFGTGRCLVWFLRVDQHDALPAGVRSLPVMDVRHYALLTFHHFISAVTLPAGADATAGTIPVRTFYTAHPRAHRPTCPAACLTHTCLRALYRTTTRRRLLHYSMLFAPRLRYRSAPRIPAPLLRPLLQMPFYAALRGGLRHNGWQRRCCLGISRCWQDARTAAYTRRTPPRRTLELGPWDIPSPSHPIHTRPATACRHAAPVPWHKEGGGGGGGSALPTPGLLPELPPTRWEDLPFPPTSQPSAPSQPPLQVRDRYSPLVGHTPPRSWDMGRTNAHRDSSLGTHFSNFQTPSLLTHIPPHPTPRCLPAAGLRAGLPLQAGYPWLSGTMSLGLPGTMPGTLPAWMPVRHYLQVFRDVPALPATSLPSLPHPYPSLLPPPMDGRWITCGPKFLRVPLDFMY